MKRPDIKIAHFLGIDIAKETFQVALLASGNSEAFREKSFANSPGGHRELLAWLANHADPSGVHACMEATGPYGDELALLLEKRLGCLSVENPRRIKGYAACRLRRNKSDPADARLIALYCATQTPRPWHSREPARITIKALARRLDSLGAQRLAESNRLALARDQFLRKDIAAHLRFLDGHLGRVKEELMATIAADPELARQHRLLCSIKGIGESSAAMILAELPDIRQLEDARQLAAYAGVTPRHRKSGTSGSNFTPMSKTGPPRLRRALFFPAISAMRFNPPCKVFADRLRAKGKRQKVHHRGRRGDDQAASSHFRYPPLRSAIRPEPPSESISIKPFAAITVTAPFPRSRPFLRSHRSESRMQESRPRRTGAAFR